MKARDKSLAHNATAESNEVNAVTQADTTPPTPNPASFTTAPEANGANAIYMVATTATDSTAVQYSFENVYAEGTGGTSSGWQDSPIYQDAGLEPNHEYGYRVRARDAGLHTTDWSPIATATTGLTIQQRIDAAVAAHPNTYVTVEIGPGTYNESLVIDDPCVTLVSSDGNAVTIIDPGAAGQQAIEISGSLVTVDGFTIKNGTQAYDATHPEQHTIWVHANYSTIKNCKIIGGGNGTQACLLIGGKAASTPATGSHGYNVAADTNQGHSILNNSFRYRQAGEGMGIYAVELTDDSSIKGNTFNGDANDMNTWTDEGAPGTAIKIHRAKKGSGTNAVIIEDNIASYVKYSWLTFSASYPWQTDGTDTLLYEHPENSEVNDVIVRNNTVHDNGFDTQHKNGAAVTFAGLRKRNVDQPTPPGIPSSADLTIGVGKVTITGNRFYSDGYGVYIWAPQLYTDTPDTYGCVMDANHIRVGPNNSIYGNTTRGTGLGYGLYNGTTLAGQDTPVQVTDIIVDANDNWWGDASGPYNLTNNHLGAGNQVSDSVTITNYLGSAP